MAAIRGTGPRPWLVGTRSYKCRGYEKEAENPENEPGFLIAWRVRPCELRHLNALARCVLNRRLAYALDAWDQFGTLAHPSTDRGFSEPITEPNLRLCRTVVVPGRGIFRPRSGPDDAKSLDFSLDLIRGSDPDRSLWDPKKGLQRRLHSLQILKRSSRGV